jgi:hypothetical protein
MRQVTEEEFFRVIGPLNVHPRVDKPSLKQRHHVSTWEMLDGTRRVIGRAESDSHGVEKTKFYLA